MPLLKLLRKAELYYNYFYSSGSIFYSNPINSQSIELSVEKFYRKKILYFIIIDTTEKGEKERGCILAIFPLFTKHDLFKPLYADIKLCLVPSLGLM